MSCSKPEVSSMAMTLNTGLRRNGKLPAHSIIRRNNRNHLGTQGGTNQLGVIAHTTPVRLSKVT